MTIRVTKFGVEVIGKPFPAVVADPFANTIFPLISEGNWRGKFSVTTSWATSISRSPTTGSEEREAQLSRPNRTTRTLISGFSREESTRMLVNAFGMASTRFPAALYSDFTVADSADDEVIECDTRWKRLFPGQRVAILPADYSLLDSFTQAQFGVLDQVTMESISFVTPLADPCAIGDIILPLMDAQVSLSSEFSAETDTVLEWEQECVEFSGSNSLPGFSDEDVRYLGLDYFDGYPIFDFLPNWKDRVTVRVEREGSLEPLGNTDVLATEEPFAHLVFSGTFEDHNRRDAWHSSRFFDSRKGRARPFWIESPLTLFSLHSVPNLAQIRLSASVSSLQLADLITHLSVRYLDGTRKFYLIDTISDEVDGDDLVLEFTLFDDLDSDDIDYVTSAHLCRFDKDSMTQEWETDGVCSYDFSCRSLVNEGVFQVTP